MHYFLSPIELTSTEFRECIDELARNSEWVGTLYSSRETASKQAGFTVIPYKSSSFMRGSRSEDEPEIEVFFSKGSMYFVLTNPSQLERMYISPRLFRNMKIFSIKAGLLVGAIGSADQDVHERASALLESIESALATRMDGRRFRHLKFEWSEANLSRPRPERYIEKLEGEESNLSFSRPQLSDSDVRKASLMAEEPLKQLMQEISSSVFVQENDLLSGRKKPGDIRSLLDKLKVEDLVASEYLIQCRKTSVNLIRVTDLESFMNSDAAQIQCGNCPRKFADENASAGYRLSPDGHRLIKASHWMTVLVTQKLVDIGVPIELIYWNIQDSGEEVDILAEYVDKIWILELKDREFGAGDAYPLN